MTRGYSHFNAAVRERGVGGILGRGIAPRSTTARGKGCLGSLTPLLPTPRSGPLNLSGSRQAAAVLIAVDGSDLRRPAKISAPAASELEVMVTVRCSRSRDRQGSLRFQG